MCQGHGDGDHYDSKGQTIFWKMARTIWVKKSQKNSLKQPAFKAWKMLSGRQMYWIFSACIKIIRPKKYESFLKKGQNWVQTLPVGIEG
jgi:hypothetical protein